MSKKKKNPKYRIELFSKQQMKEMRKCQKVLRSKIEDYILKHAASEMVMEN